jgi:uncharacterized protein (UPF0335 family)
MANMSYCRFENTLKDLQDCEENLFSEVNKEGYENQARRRIIELCHLIADQVPLDEIDNLPTR